MTHDPDHDQRAMNPDLSTTNGLNDRRLDQTYREAQRGPREEPQRARRDQVPWELRGARSPAPRPGPSTTTRVLVALVLVIALVAALVGRW